MKLKITLAFSLIAVIPLLTFALMLLFVGYRGEKKLRNREHSVVQSELSEQEASETGSSGEDYSETERILVSIPETEYAIIVDPFPNKSTGKVRVNLTYGQLMGIVFLVLTLTSIPIAFWFYNSIVTPLSNLRKATLQIKNGNLDFKLEMRGQDEIGDLCRDFEEMRIRLKESAEAKLFMDKQNMELISNISHDLKTPLTTIEGYVEGLMDGVADTPEKMDRYTRVIYNKSIEMDHLINELTFYSKIDTNGIPYNFEKLNVADFYDSCVQELKMELPAKNVSFFSLNQIEKDGRIIADPVQLRRVIMNIINNSVKYSDPKKESSWIKLRFLDASEDIRIEIEDNGTGIEARHLPYIFDRFYRSDASRNSSRGGSGIGLSIVKKIVEDHGGYVWASSTPGEGTTLYLSFRKYRGSHEQNIDHRG